MTRAGKGVIGLNPYVVHGDPKIGVRDDSEQALCRDVQVNLAYRWFCGLSIEDKIPDHSAVASSITFSEPEIDHFVMANTAAEAMLPHIAPEPQS